MKKENAIGVIDSGVGGLTVAKEILSCLPCENVYYFGDSKNCPFGNKTEDEIIALAVNMIKFLENKGIKCIVLACNTTSALIEKIRPLFDFPIISIVEAAAGMIISGGYGEVGLIATNFTVNSGSYEKHIKKGLPDCRVYGIGSENLSELVDSGHIDDKPVEEEITFCIDKLLSQKNVKDVILGCTHYPIPLAAFKRLYPDIEFLDPAVAQVKELRRVLSQNGALNESGGEFRLYTSGEFDNYMNIMKLLDMRKPDYMEKTV